MSRIPEQTEADHPEDQDPAADSADSADRNEETRKAVPAWVISFVAHALVLSLMAIIAVASQVERDEPSTLVAVLPDPIKEPEHPKVREVEQPKIDLDIKVEVEDPSPVTELDVEVEKFETEDDMVIAEARGRPDMVSDVEMAQSPTAFIAMGPGMSAPGLRGNRGVGGKQRGIGKHGGTPGGERAVDAALRWFKRHQSPNGQWDVDGYPANCSENPKCEPGTERTGEDGDLASSAYALLCFLGSGYDHQMPSKYRTTVRKGIDWLVAAQKADGAWGERNYEHPIVVMAIAEAYAMSNDPALRLPAQRGIDIVLARQARDAKGGYGLGWDYVKPNPDRNDASVTGWNVMALKAGTAGGLDVKDGMDGAKQYLERAWKATNKDFVAKDPYSDMSTFPYTWNASTDAVQVSPGGGSHDMAGVGAACAVFLGHKSDDVMLNSLANYVVANQLPKGYPTNTYYLYYNTLAIFQVGGDRWETWNKAFAPILIGAQRRDEDCFDGSWDYQNTVFHGHQTGRILSTAFCCLSLEVYYRYLQMDDTRPH